MIHGRTAFPTVLLALAGVLGVGALAHAGWLSRPVPARAPEAGEAVATPAERPPACLFVVVDGLRAEAVADPATTTMPRLVRLGERGVRGVAITGEPTMSAPCIRTLLTGRLPDLYTAFRNFDAQPTGGSVIEALARRGARAAHAGDGAIPHLVGRWYARSDVLDLAGRTFPGIADLDDFAFPAALARAAEPGVDVLTAHLVTVDLTGHFRGADGPDYDAACRVADERVDALASAFLARRPDALVLVAADHGLSPRGTHGSGEAAARRAPFVLVGPRVARASGVEVAQAALAPTVAALLRLPPPPLAEAPPEFALTTIPPAEQAEFLDAFVRARLAVARSLGADDVAAAVDARRARAFEAGGARALADLAAALRDLDDRVFRGAGTLPRWAALAAAVALLAGLARRAGASARETVGVGGGLLAAAALAGATFSVREAWVGADDPRPLAARGAAVLLAALAALLVVVVRRARAPRGPRPPWRERVAALAERRPGTVALAGGAAILVPLSLRLAIDPVVHLPILYAGLAFLAVLALASSPRARSAAAGPRACALAAAAVVFLGGRAAVVALGEGWLRGPAGNGAAWTAVAALGAGALAADALRRRARRDPGARLSAALAAAVVAHALLARESAAAGAGFALLACGARAAAEIPGPASRGGAVLLALALLAVQVASFHALGHDHSLSTVDVGGAIVPRSALAGTGAAAGPDVPWGSVLALAARIGLLWTVLLLPAARAAPPRFLLSALALALAGGATALVAALPAWGTWAWWAVAALPLYALTAVSLCLLLPFAALLRERGHRASAPVAGALPRPAAACG